MASLDELLTQLGSDDQSTAFAAKRQLGVLATTVGAPGQEAQRAELAQKLAQALTTPRKVKQADGTETDQALPLSARRKLLRVLALVAGESEVSAIASCLDEFELREEARWTLDRMVAPGATAALVEAARGGIGPEFRVGAINALGRREAEAGLEALKRATVDEDVEVRNAAAEALARFTDGTSDALLAAVLKFGSPTPRTRTRVVRARVRLAERLAKVGQKDAAQVVYQAVIDQADGEADAPQVAAAMRGLEALA